MKATGSFILFCLFLLFEIIYSREEKDVLKFTKRYAHEEKAHVFKEHEICNNEFYSKFHKTMMRTTCMPRPTIVGLVASGGEILLVPSRVLVNRCSGECHAKQSCLATNSTRTAFEVQKLNIVDNTQKCGVVYVEEHTRCSCKCTVMKEHCNMKQIYKQGECMCLCINDEERKLCNETPGRFWDSDQCSCQCHAEKVCSTGLVWVASHCSCAKLMNDEENEIDIIYQD